MAGLLLQCSLHEILTKSLHVLHVSRKIIKIGSEFAKLQAKQYRLLEGSISQRHTYNRRGDTASTVQFHSRKPAT
jgi:hypothetical protein